VITLAAPTAVPNLVQIRPWGFWTNGRNITIFYLYLFSGAHLQKLLIAVIVQVDQTGEQYSSNGRTYVTKALVKIPNACCRQPFPDSAASGEKSRWLLRSYIVITCLRCGPRNVPVSSACRVAGR